MPFVTRSPSNIAAQDFISEAKAAMRDVLDKDLHENFRIRWRNGAPIIFVDEELSEPQIVELLEVIRASTGVVAEIMITA